MPKSYKKDAVAVLDYGWNWAPWLNGDTIQTSTWEVPSPLEIEAEGATDTETYVWLSGGVLGEEYPVVNRIVTNSSPSRVTEMTFIIKIVDR